jgi:hypothetical protein
VRNFLFHGRKLFLEQDVLLRPVRPEEHDFMARPLSFMYLNMLINGVIPMPPAIKTNESPGLLRKEKTP